MSYLDDKHVITGRAILLWDGVGNPQPNDSGAMVWSAKVAIPANDPCVAELENISRNALNDSEFKGALPPNGIWSMTPVNDADIQKYGPLVAGHTIINAKSFKGCPQVFDLQGNELNPMTYKTRLYAGTIVALLVHCYTYNNKSKGVGFGLDGLQIVDHNAPRLDVGSGLAPAQVAAAFGGRAGGMPPAAATMPHPTQPAGGAPAYGPPTTTPTPPAPAPAAPATAAPAPNAPYPGILATPQSRMIATDYTYDQYVASGWTEDQLVAAGKMRAA